MANLVGFNQLINSIIISNLTEVYHTVLPKKAVTLVAPGLNVRPLAMSELIKLLNENGSDVCLLSFPDIYQTKADPVVWIEEFVAAYDLARSMANKHSVSLYFMGYSLGALLGQYLMTLRSANIHFMKQILIAPAIAIKLPKIIKSSVFLLNDNLKIPSYTPNKYRLNNFLPTKVYKQMFAWERSISKAGFKHSNIPTLLIIDPKDELVSYTKIRKGIEQYNLTNYQLIILDTDLKGRSTKYHHLIVDEATMGKNNWLEVKKKIRQFF